MKYHLKTPKYWDVFPICFRPKKNDPYYEYWKMQKYLKPHSHSGGRKPYWRKKRKIQRQSRI